MLRGALQRSTRLAHGGVRFRLHDGEFTPWATLAGVHRVAGLRLVFDRAVVSALPLRERAAIGAQRAFRAHAFRQHMQTLAVRRRRVVASGVLQSFFRQRMQTFAVSGRRAVASGVLQSFWRGRQVRTDLD